MNNFMFKKQIFFLLLSNGIIFFTSCAKNNLNQQEQPLIESRTDCRLLNKKKLPTKTTQPIKEKRFIIF